MGASTQGFRVMHTVDDIVSAYRSACATFVSVLWNEWYRTVYEDNLTQTLIDHCTYQCSRLQPLCIRLKLGLLSFSSFPSTEHSKTIALPDRQVRKVEVSFGKVMAPSLKALTSAVLIDPPLAPVPTPTPIHATAQNITHGDNHFVPDSFATASMVGNQQDREIFRFAGPGGDLEMVVAVFGVVVGVGATRHKGVDDKQSAAS